MATNPCKCWTFTDMSWPQKLVFKVGIPGQGYTTFTGSGWWEYYERRKQPKSQPPAESEATA